MAGNCLAGDSCMFSHDPTTLMSRLTVEGDVTSAQANQPEFQLQDFDSFPVLQASTSNSDDQLASGIEVGSPLSQPVSFPRSMLNPFANFVPSEPRSRPDSRPASQQASRANTPSAPAFNDDEAFPTLGSAAINRQGKRHHGKRGHGHGGHKDAQVPLPSSMAEMVRMSPSPSPMLQTRRGLRPTRSYTGSREDSAAAQAIPTPEHVPWLDTGDSTNRAYLKARAEAFRHGGLRNKFLQSAAQAWNRNDARGAKALSLRGQNENALMKEAHREAARVLYEERNKHTTTGRELYVDLHGESRPSHALYSVPADRSSTGLHPEEAVSYLNSCLMEHTTSPNPIYAICGTGHHSKNGKDKVGKAVRSFLNDYRYAFREFSVPGDRNNVGGILGIDPSSYDKELARRIKSGSGEAGSEADSGVGIVTEDTKVRIIKAEDARKMEGV